MNQISIPPNSTELERRAIIRAWLSEVRGPQKPTPVYDVTPCKVVTVRGPATARVWASTISYSGLLYPQTGAP